jgi:hypothetical protein
MRIARGFVSFCALVALLTPSLSFSQSARFSVHELLTGASGCRIDIPTGTSFLTVNVDGSKAPFKTARFKVVPSVPIPGIPVGGQDFDITAPASASIVVNNPGAMISQVRFDIMPHTGDAEVLLTDNAGLPMLGGGTYSMYCDNWSSFLAPYKSVPAHGATNVPINTTLSFTDGVVTAVVLSTVPFHYMAATYICTNNTLSFPTLTVCTYPINPGILQPNTTYYWQASLERPGCPEGCVAFSPVLSFTTAGPVATAQQTWGAVKAMYRD